MLTSILKPPTRACIRHLNARHFCPNQLSQERTSNSNRTTNNQTTRTTNEEQGNDTRGALSVAPFWVLRQAKKALVVQYAVLTGCEPFLQLPGQACPAPPGTFFSNVTRETGRCQGPLRRDRSESHLSRMTRNLITGIRGYLDRHGVYPSVAAMLELFSVSRHCMKEGGSCSHRHWVEVSLEDQNEQVFQELLLQHIPSNYYHYLLTRHPCLNLMPILLLLHLLRTD